MSLYPSFVACVLLIIMTILPVRQSLHDYSPFPAAWLVWGSIGYVFGLLGHEAVPGWPGDRLYLAGFCVASLLLVATSILKHLLSVVLGSLALAVVTLRFRAIYPFPYWHHIPFVWVLATVWIGGAIVLGRPHFERIPIVILTCLLCISFSGADLGKSTTGSDEWSLYSNLMWSSLLVVATAQKMMQGLQNLPWQKRGDTI